jgi:hypothetical protein
MEPSLLMVMGMVEEMSILPGRKVEECFLGWFLRFTG